MPSPQALSENDRRLVASWAADGAERVLPLFEAEAADDARPRDAIARRFVAGRAAGAVTGAAAVAAARSAAQASEVAHMGAHALGAAAYAARAAGEAADDKAAAVEAELAWQLAHMDERVRAALSLLPGLGADRSGPLGAGLLANGDLGEHIRRL